MDGEISLILWRLRYFLLKNLSTKHSLFKKIMNKTLMFVIKKFLATSFVDSLVNFSQS